MTFVEPSADSAQLRGQIQHLRHVGRMPEAERLVSEALQRFPEQPWPLAEAVWLAQAHENWAETITLSEQMCTRFPKSPVGYTAGAFAMRKNGQFDAADAVLEAAMLRFPQEEWVLAEAAWVASDRREWLVGIRAEQPGWAGGG
jgi:hypothetical protein